MFSLPLTRASRAKSLSAGTVPALIPAFVLTMTLTIYVPQAGGINGGGIMADGNQPKIGYAACGPRYPFGTVFELLVEDMPHGLPRVFECRDRGRSVGNQHLDMVLLDDNVRQALANAKQWGKQHVPVRVWKDWSTYQAADPPI